MTRTAMYIVKCPMCKNYGLVSYYHTMQYFSCEHCSFDTRKIKYVIHCFSKSITVNSTQKEIKEYGK